MRLRVVNQWAFVWVAPSPRGPPADIKQGGRLQVVLGERLLVGSFEWQFRDSHCVCWGALCGKSWRCEIIFYPLPFLYSFLSFIPFFCLLAVFCQLPCTPLPFFIHHLCLFPHLTQLFVSVSPFSPTALPLLLFPRLATVPLHLFHPILLLFPPYSVSPFPFCLLLYFPADLSLVWKQSCSGNINNPTGCVKPQRAEAENRSFSG